MYILTTLIKAISKLNPKLEKVTTTSENPTVTPNCDLAQGSIKVNGIEYSRMCYDESLQI